MEKVAQSPIVTVICTCFNQALYVQEALESVIQQTYPHIQLIVVDNASSDNSAHIIESFLRPHPHILFIRNKKNLGICQAFNQASEYATGKYLVDLSADDILLPERIQLQVHAFENLNNEYGLLYSGIEEIDQNGNTLQYVPKPNQTLHSGHVFQFILKKYFIPSPSTMFRKKAFDCVGKYNENLAFEDFDFWIRCAHRYKFFYLPITSTKKRILSTSFSKQFYSTESDKMLVSTLKTYLWAREKLQNHDEHNAYNEGLSYFFRQAVFLGHFETALAYKAAFTASRLFNFKTMVCFGLLFLRFDLSFFYLLQKKFRSNL